MSIITYPLNNIDYDASDAETYLCTRNSGVFAGSSFPLSITGDRVLTVGKGAAWICNAEFKGKSIVSNTEIDLTVPVSDPFLPRIDRVVLGFDKAANQSMLYIKQGTPASNPAAPSLSRTEMLYELGLFAVSVPAASSLVRPEDVEDTRLNTEACGLMTDPVSQADTESIEAQFSSLLNRLEQELDDVEQGSGIMLTAVYDADNKVAQAGGIPAALAKKQDKVKSGTIAPGGQAYVPVSLNEVHALVSNYEIYTVYLYGNANDVKSSIMPILKASGTGIELEVGGEIPSPDGTGDITNGVFIHNNRSSGYIHYVCI